MTSLVRYRPFLPMRDIFENFMHEGFLGPKTEAAGDYLPVDVNEGDDEYLVTASVPGATAEELSIEVEDGVVSISAQVSSEDKTDRNGYLVRERKTGCFQRRLRMPDGLDAGKASAVLENGVVTLTLPKAPEVKRKRIAVKVQ